MKVVVNNRNAFVGCLGHMATHSMFFTILFRLAIKFQFPFPFYILIWMSILMFFVGAFLCVRTFIKQLRNEHEKRFFPIQTGSLFLIYLCNSMHWSFMIFAQLQPESLPIVNLVVFSQAADNIFTCFFSFAILKRKINYRHFIALITGLVGIFFANFLKIQKIQGQKPRVVRFELDFEITNARFQSYFYLILSRLAFSLTAILYKRALLHEASIQRFRAFKMSPYRHLKIFDFEPSSDLVGELIKPTVSQSARVFVKAQHIINLRKLVADSLSDDKSVENRKPVIEEIDKVEKVKVMRQSAVSERQKEIVLQELRKENVPSEENMLEYYNKWSKLMLKVPPKFDKIMAEKLENRRMREMAIKEQELEEKNKDPQQEFADSYIDPEGKKLYDDIPDDHIDEETQKQFDLRRLWSVAMSEEMQELLKDYKGYQLHEHLFDGDDDLWLTKLDIIFDDQTFDFELFGKEEPSHQLLMSFIGGLTALPLYLVMNFMSLNETTIEKLYPPASFMGIIEAYRYPAKFNFYDQMFASRWENLLIMLAIAILYMLKPIATTRFILSLSPSHGSLTYVVTEIFSKILFVFVSLVCIDKKFTVGKLQAFGIIIAMLSQLLYFWASQDNGRKNRIEIQSASQAVREVFHFDNLSELAKVDNILRDLDPITGPLDYLESYSLLLDALLSRDSLQLTTHLNFSTLQTSPFFDPKHHKLTCLWGDGYPRPSYEYLRYAFIIKDNYEFQRVPRDELLQIPGANIYDPVQYAQLIKQRQEQAEKLKVKEDLESEPVKKTTFAKNPKRMRQHEISSTQKKLNDASNNDVSQEDERMYTTQNLLMEATTKGPPLQADLDKTKEAASICDNQSSVIIDELSDDNYSDGLDSEDDTVEIDQNNYDQVQKSVQMLAVSKSQFYPTQNQEENEPKQENEPKKENETSKKKKKKKITKVDQEDDFSRQFRIQRKQSLLVEDIK